VNAFLFLVTHSARNRFRSQLTRARSPRYAAALIVGGAYLWLFLVRQTPHSGGFGSLLLGQPTEMIVSLLALVTLMGAWVFGSDTTALAFTPAELSLLFPAPLSRRALIGYKLYRAQIAVLFNALIWVFVLRRGGTFLPSPLRAIGIWLLFSTLNLHRLAAALVRASWREHGTSGARRHWTSAVFFGVLVALIGVGLFQERAALAHASGVGQFFITLGRVLAKRPASIGLLPFHLVVAPTFARSVSDWEQLILPALVVCLLHPWWVLRTDAAFEDAAIVASAARVKKLEAMRSRRSAVAVGTSRPATSTLRLAAQGHPAMAIVWKNMLCLRRTAQLRLFIGPTVMALALGAAVSEGARDAGAFITSSALMLGLMMMVFGGRLIRNDLRHDMLHLPLLKSLPIGSGDIVLAEVASSALPMAALQFVLLVIAFVASLNTEMLPLAIEIRIGLLIASPFVVLALNGALLTIQNGTAVLFPSWIRLGPAVNTGVETLGQNVLATVANLFSLAIALIVPLLVGYVAVMFLHEPRAASVALIAIVASVLLGLETYGAIRVVGRALGRAEPPSTG
jgi:ABC-2 type transport system permease protein